ncbi:glycine/D-amino acid oxidase-like deaminating enzyme [Sphingomonas kyeonggiensis]|uniref:Glycine/D-amino acid oxidase-like deaminating enzyme n=1 Tax=Sphingomonas kyeonggiensis TaxID=1268553 RepID=A0A7W7K3J8_9SPHN|nr:FAD-binding oxidoreductase [Sphingomonas kyeonggiensis]MBB4839983.1 glycine/D-amino acid oxidase-like deaminating enzyme [Sphingomonas kyeonggiensis]
MRIDRRATLGLLAAAPLLPAAVCARPAAPGTRTAIVIGAGIVGAAIAYELAKRGVAVTILEKSRPAAGATGDSFAYLNASTKTGSRPYFQLNWLGMAGWRIWQQEAGPALPLQWGGATYWRDSEAEAARLGASLRIAQSWGYAGRSVDAGALKTLLPGLDIGPVSAAAFFPEEGAVDPVGAVAALLERARKLGAKLRAPVEVRSLLVRDGKVAGVQTADGVIEADTVVLAAGLGSEALAGQAGIGLPLTASPGVLLHTRPQRPVLDRVVFAPRSTFKQMPDGRFVASISGHEGGAPEGAGGEAFGQAIQHAAATYLPGIANAGIERVSVGQRVVPADSFPVVGFAPKLGGLYVAVTHSGVTLAPALGRLAAQEIVDGITAEPLDAFRPDRFA